MGIYKSYQNKIIHIHYICLTYLIGGMTYLPTILIDLEPENSTNVGLVYSDDISL